MKRYIKNEIIKIWLKKLNKFVFITVIKVIVRAIRATDTITTIGTTIHIVVDIVHFPEDLELEVLEYL